MYVMIYTICTLYYYNMNDHNRQIEKTRMDVEKRSIMLVMRGFYVAVSDTGSNAIFKLFQFVLFRLVQAPCVSPHKRLGRGTHIELTTFYEKCFVGHKKSIFWD